MGSSSKKKKEKRKDFQKPKLKVGKTRPQPSNTTDTSFKSKGIILKEQSLYIEAPSPALQFTRNVSMLSSRSDGQRKDALSYLVGVITTRSVGEPLPVSEGTVVSRLLPLALDGSDGIREYLLKALQGFRPDEVAGLEEKILLYVRAGMTHLAAGIRETSMDILSWAIELIGDALVCCAGGWIKTLKYIAIMLGWPIAEGHSSVSRPSASSKQGEHRTLLKAVNNLIGYLKTGLIEHDSYAHHLHEQSFPMTCTSLHVLPQQSAPYTYLNLFEPRRDVEGEMYVSREDRRSVFFDSLQEIVTYGLNELKKEGGEIGRAAASGQKILNASTFNG